MLDASACELTGPSIASKIVLASSTACTCLRSQAASTARLNSSSGEACGASEQDAGSEAEESGAECTGCATVKRMHRMMQTTIQSRGADFTRAGHR